MTMASRSSIQAVVVANAGNDELGHTVQTVVVDSIVVVPDDMISATYINMLKAKSSVQQEIMFELRRQNSKVDWDKHCIAWLCKGCMQAMNYGLISSVQALGTLRLKVSHTKTFLSQYGRFITSIGYKRQGQDQ